MGLFIILNNSYDPNISVLIVELPSYETTTYYYLKLLDNRTDEIVQSVFIPDKHNQFLFLVVHMN